MTTRLSYEHQHHRPHPFGSRRTHKGAPTRSWLQPDGVWAMKMLAQKAGRAFKWRGHNPTWSCAVCTLSLLDSLAFATEADIRWVSQFTGILHEELHDLCRSAREACRTMTGLRFDLTTNHSAT